MQARVECRLWRKPRWAPGPGLRAPRLLGSFPCLARRQPTKQRGKAKLELLELKHLQLMLTQSLQQSQRARRKGGKAKEQGEKKKGAPRRDSHSLMSMQLEALAETETSYTGFVGAKWAATGRNWWNYFQDLQGQLETTEDQTEVRTLTRLTTVGKAAALCSLPTRVMDGTQPSRPTSMHERSCH